MAKQTRKTNPGDAANAFVRVILSDAGAMLGGLIEDEWRMTIEWFDGHCAYTGQALDEGEVERDHAIPMNRTQCGLHLYGNVVPATKDANRRKGGKHYREFIEDRDRLERVDEFLRESAYWDRVADLGDLQRYCEAQYRAIDALCRVNRKYLSSLLPPVVETTKSPRWTPPRWRQRRMRARTHCKLCSSHPRHRHSERHCCASATHGSSRSTGTDGERSGVGTPPECRRRPASSGICEPGPGIARAHGNNWDSSPWWSRFAIRAPRDKVNIVGLDSVVARGHRAHAGSLARNQSCADDSSRG